MHKHLLFSRLVMFSQMGRCFFNFSWMRLSSKMVFFPLSKWLGSEMWRDRVTRVVIIEGLSTR